MQSFVTRPLVALFTFVIGTAVAMIPSVFGPGAVTDQSAAERAVLEVQRAYLRAHVDRDTATLDRVLADDFTIGSSPYRRVSKAQRLAMLENEDFTFLSIDDREVQVTINGDFAVVTGEAVVKGRYQDRDFVSPRYWFARTFEKRDGQWQIVAVQANRFARW